MTTQFVEPWAPEFTGTSWYVSKNGSDTSDAGRGSMDKPYLTIQNAINLASAGDRIYVARGVYAEAVTVNKTLYISAIVPGSVTVQIAAALSSAVTYSGTQTAGVWDGINIVNTNNAAWTSIALNFNNIAGTMTGKYIFTKCNILGGVAGGGVLASAVVAAGNNAAAVQVEIDSPRMLGGQQILMGTGDTITFRDCFWTEGPQDWFGITAGGTVYIKGCVLLGAGTTERINFGGATALSAILCLESSHINGLLYLNNAAGTGYVICRDVGGLYAITNNQRDNIVQYWDGDYVTIQMQSINANANGNHTLFTVPAGRQFFPERVTTSNKVQATGGAFNYQYNGSGAASIVAAVGAGAFALGTTVNTCLADVVPAAGTVVMGVTASGQAGDLVDATVRGRLV